MGRLEHPQHIRFRGDVSPNGEAVATRLANIGEGAFGRVFPATDLESGEEVVV